jgi:DNA adenine methylase
MFKKFHSSDLCDTLRHVEKRIEEYGLSKINELGYKDFRNFYNKAGLPLDLFVLIAFSFNHQIRFNNKHQFNVPFGKNRSSFNNKMRSNLEKFILKLKEKEVEFTSSSFESFDLSAMTEYDFVYCDPPYLITTGSYNDGKRGFKGWTQKEEIHLLEILDRLNNMGVRFALSNVIYHKGRENTILKKWIGERNYDINYLNKDYSNSNYQTKVKNKNTSVEALVTNYNPTHRKGKKHEQEKIMDTNRRTS